ncbi:hypothetical protein JY651_31015 [Pyxidicoccus parkwayensis]|uniref:CARDB domain-containing protein n=1 Tax=Pyxidicoccus parkwayensis TaxID=2813578 RepID=A0ABX7NLH7_9BACT|nr:CARDB domain-containing protein [Pyxidicoccus parkwaysis]QSQ19709.1 hypothetical protein JY651_31015 [Pyxidicoccus parkwaysis]
MKRLMPVTRATSLWLAMGWLAGCGGASPPTQEPAPGTQSSALEQYGPDLVVTEVQAPPSLRSGQSFTATVKVCNRGTEPATNYYSWPSLELYLSMDDSLSMPGPGTPPPTDQRMVGSIQVPPLDPGQCTLQTVPSYASLPQDAQGDGAFYLGAIVDVYQALNEADETNNAFVAGKVGVGYRSDLVVTDISVPASVRPGNAFTARVRVCNQGTESSSYSSQPTLELYLSLDDVLSAPGSTPGTPPPTDQRMVGSISLPTLYAGQCVTRDVNANAWLPPDAQGDGAFYLGAIVDAYQSEQELREDNNTFVSGLIGVGYRSDLIVTEVKGPVSVHHGDAFTATVKVCNQGTESTSGNNAWVELYLSMDDSIVLEQPGPGTPPLTDQRKVGSVDVPWLAAGQCATRTVNASAWLPPDAQGDGAYYLGAIVDAFQSEQELREDNNTRVAGKVGVGSRSDLVVTEVSGPTSVRSSEPFVAKVKVCNQGTESTSGWNNAQVELYLSMDTELTAPQMSGPYTPPPSDQRSIGTVSVPSLNAGQCVTRDVNAYAGLPPAAMPDGAFYLGAIVDAYQSEPELREDNNITVGGLIGVGYRSDLVVTRISAPTSVNSGNSFNATVRVCNQGTEATNGWYGSQVELYLSTDTELTAPQMSGPGMPPSDQRLIGSVSVPSLQAGQCADRTVNAVAYPPPDSQPDGAFYLGAIVDPNQSEQELREDNNTLISGLIGVGYRADLVVTAVSGPASVGNGNSFTASVTVCNQGTVPTSGWYGTRVELYLSMDRELTVPTAMGPGMPVPTDQRMIGTVDLPTLSQGQCATRTVNAYGGLPPDAMGEGAFYLAAVVDPQQSELELREDNNVFIGGLIGVGYRSDLVVTQVSGPTSVRSGEPFTATVKVCNQGTQPTSGWYGSQVELYLSMDTELTLPQTSGPYMPMPGDQRFVGSQSIPSLAAGQCASVSVNAYAGTPPDAMGEGAFYLAAVADPYQQEPELREDNNVTVGSLVGVGYRSDLVVTRISAPANVRSGEPFTASVKVCNQGTESTQGWSSTRVELYLSTDTELSFASPSAPYPSDQRMIGSLDLPSLGAGQCVTRDVNANAWLPPDAINEGPIYLGAIVDPSRNEQELREDNNVYVSGIIGVGSRPDLVVTSIIAPVSVRPGDPFTAKVKVCNQGTEATYGSWTYLELYLSMDTTLTAPPMSGPAAPPTDQRMIGAVDLPTLSAGQCVTRDVNAYAGLPPEAMGVGPAYLGAIVDTNQSVLELREDNNTFISGLIGVGDGPDLVVTEVKGPTSVRPGDNFTVTAKVCNQGTAPLGYGMWPQLEVYLSTDDTLSFPQSGNPYPTDQRMVGMDSLPPLQPGECSTRTLTGYASLPPDAQWDSALYLGAIVDVYVSVQELREDNNVLVGGLIGVGSRSDLVVTEVSGPASVRPGDSFTASVKVCNQGTESTSSPSQSRLDLYLTANESVVVPTPGGPYPQYPTEGQQLIGGVDLAPLGAGQCVTLSVPAYGSLPPGAPNVTAYHLAAVVDAYRSEQELREDNNVLVGGLIGVGNAADLVVTEVSGPPSVQRDQPFTASVKVCNQGTEPSNGFSNARLEVYLSTTSTLTMMGPGMPPYPPSNQRMVGSVDVQPLMAGQCQTLSVQASANTPPDAVMDGALYLGAIIDAARYVSELREDNNLTVGGLMGVGNLPDLVVTEVSGPSSLRNNDSFTASVKVCNQGTTPAGNPYGSEVALFISTDTTLSPMGPGPMPMDQSMVAVTQLNPLAPGQCATVSIPASAYLPPAAQGPGNYYLGAYVNQHRNEPELREDNNARADFVFAATW